MLYNIAEISTKISIICMNFNKMQYIYQEKHLILCVCQSIV